ncbi:hypothetical protein GIB67_036292 [Kingdonia uniflora]|uniref:RCC1-like domain-containing protein n=1 Tax=Kingdonia uniflora TaxID=39325 RepID=A0A7J7L3Q3_9MAGN|nr:hypothetical protein GIB67_036292 [Kingdonia uniflora]
MAASDPIMLAWGSGEDGQLGIGINEEKDCVCAVKVLQSHRVSFVVAGSRNSVAISEDGKLFTWGWNQRGTLGHQPESKAEDVPSQVKALGNAKIVQAAIGGWHCLAVDDQGRAYAWGGNEYGQCGDESERKDDNNRALRRDIMIPQRCAPKLSVRQVAAGGTHSVVLTHEGHVWTWGQPWPPGDIKQISTPVRVQGLEKVKVIAVGAFHNLALLEEGKLWAWGNNEYGQLGTGDTQPRSQPIPVQGLSDLTLILDPTFLVPEGSIRVRMGLEYSRRLPEIYAQCHYSIGSHVLHRMKIIGHMVRGIRIWRPIRVNGKEVDTQIYVGTEKVEDETTLLEYNESIVVGFPVCLMDLDSTHEIRAGLVDIAAGGWHSTALTNEGEVYGWGRGEHGRLGFGDDKSSKMVPQKVQLLVDEDIVQVSCGGTHSVALTRDGRMFSFGRGDHGRLGYGRKVTTGHPMEVPINLPPPSNLSENSSVGSWCAKLVACGGRHTLAVAVWQTDEYEEQ